MLVSTFLVLLLLLQIKHLVIDWIWQPPYEWKNKGTYGHWGGVRHALKNAVGTALCFLIALPAPVSIWAILLVLIADFGIHYHIDWCKMNLNSVLELHPMQNCEFWWLLGFDQFCHQITYIFIMWMVL